MLLPPSIPGKAKMRNHDRKENYPYLHQCSSAQPRAVKQDAYAATAGHQIAAPFQFNARRMPIDWRLLHGIDVSKLVSSAAVTASLPIPSSGLTYTRPSQPS